MKCSKLLLFFGLAIYFSAGQAQTAKNTPVPTRPNVDHVTYQLFPTQNFWTFIKLDTRNGKMWQVHFTIKNEEVRGELILNSQSLVEVDQEKNGRFTLYPTENMYNFLLLDQYNGKVYQVQWSMEEDYRGILPVN
jgi:hypothetical protein